MVVDESLIMVRDFTFRSCNDLLVPVGIPPSELSDTCKSSHGKMEINQIDRIEPRSSAERM